MSATPTGPFVRQGIAIPPWSHNPEAIVTPDGTWVIYTLGPGLGHTVEKKCVATAHADDQLPPATIGRHSLDVNSNQPVNTNNVTVNFTVHSASSPQGMIFILFSLLFFFLRSSPLAVDHCTLFFQRVDQHDFVVVWPNCSKAYSASATCLATSTIVSFRTCAFYVLRVAHSYSIPTAISRSVDCDSL